MAFAFSLPLTVGPCTRRREHSLYVCDVVAVAQSDGDPNRWSVRVLWRLARSVIFRDAPTTSNSATSASAPAPVREDEPVVDTDGLEERLLAREQRERARAEQRRADLLRISAPPAPPTPPPPEPQNEKKGGFLFFRRRQEKQTIRNDVNDVESKPLDTTAPPLASIPESTSVSPPTPTPAPTAQQLDADTQQATPIAAQKSWRRGGGFLFFGRRNEKENEVSSDIVVDEKPDVPAVPKVYGGLYESRVYDYVAEGIDRKANDAPGELQTLLPYDLQRALFDELKKETSTVGENSTSRSTSKNSYVTPSTPKRRRGPPAPVAPEEPEAEAQKPEPSGLPLPLRWVLSPAGALISVFRPSKGKETKETSASSEVPALMNGDTTKAGAEAVYAAALARDTDTSNSADDAGLADGGAAAAYATAAAIATSATVRGQTDAQEEKRLLSAVTAARAVDNEQDARIFVETVGVQPLVRAACALNGLSQSAALTALANLAIMLPKSRIDMLNADKGALVSELLGVVQGPGAFTPTGAAANALAHTEALVSGTHLLGSLALAPGKAGRDWRLRLASTPELVRNLKRLAGGLKNGGPEGAARASRRALGALGINEWRPRVPGQRGLRILSIDGGGTRAIMAFEMLKHLKRMTGCEIHELFDVIGGTSTGAIVAASLGIAHKTVEEVEQLYRELIGKIFAKHPVNGPKLLLTRAYYDTKVFEDILKRECGSGVFMDSQAEEHMNKVFVVSSVMSRRPQELHVFRNYTYPPGHESRYDGTVEAQLWEALRASSAAPTFFSEIRVNGELHADGAIVANNPTAVAIHEAKSVYPGVPVELVVSIGNGQAPNDSADVARENGKKNVGWGEVFGSIVASATSTETVHHVLVDLFPEDKYFRFNPTTDSTQIDETRPDQLALFVKDSKHYIKVNSNRFESVAAVLRPKTPATLWKRFTSALAKEIQVLRRTMREDDLYLPNNRRL